MPDEAHFEDHHGDGYGIGGVIDEHVIKNDINDDRSEQGEPDWNEAADQENESSDHLKGGDGLEITCIVEHAEKLRRITSHRRHGHERMKSVGTENREDKTEE